MKTNRTANCIATIRVIAMLLAVVMVVGVEIKTVQRLQRQYTGLSVYQSGSQQFPGGNAGGFDLGGIGR